MHFVHFTAIIRTFYCPQDTLYCPTLDTFYCPNHFTVSLRTFSSWKIGSVSPRTTSCNSHATKPNDSFLSFILIWGICTNGCQHNVCLSHEDNTQDPSFLLISSKGLKTESITLRLKEIGGGGGNRVEWSYCQNKDSNLAVNSHIPSRTTPPLDLQKYNKPCLTSVPWISDAGL